MTNENQPQKKNQTLNRTLDKLLFYSAGLLMGTLMALYFIGIPNKIQHFPQTKDHPPLLRQYNYGNDHIFVQIKEDEYVILSRYLGLTENKYRYDCKCLEEMIKRDINW